jgi:tetratricopeptide (TPR) repeat protein
MSGLLTVAGIAGAWMATGYGEGFQEEQAGFDPVLNAPATLASMLVRAGYEQTHLRCEDAGRHIHAVLAVRPDWAGAQAMLLVCDVQEVRRVDQRDDLSRLIVLQPDNPEWWSERATVYAGFKYWDEAISDITHAIELRPRSAALYRWRSKWKAEKRDVTGEFEDVEAMHRLSPSEGSLWEEMAELAKSAGKSEADELHYRKTAAINPKVLPDGDQQGEERHDEELSTAGMSVGEMMLRAGYAQRLKKYNLELHFLNAALSVDPKLIPTLEMRLGLEMSDGLDHRAGADRNLNALEQDLDRLIQLNPSSDYYAIRLERARRRGDSKACLRYYAQMIALEPYSGTLYAARAAVEMDLKLVDAAIEDYKRAAYLMPGNAMVYRALGFSFDEKKDFASELAMLNLAQIGFPDDEILKRQRQAAIGKSKQKSPDRCLGFLFVFWSVLTG